MSEQGYAAGELDAQELLHLALKAMEDGRDADAIGFLKRGLALDPEDGRMHYLLGAMHAQLGMYERAIGELQTAVRLAPHIEMAHFQLGLLQLTSGDVDAARSSWEPLQGLEADHPLTCFMTGMLQLTADNFEGCIDSLRLGITLNEEYEALNRDMAKVIEAAEKARPAGSNGAASPSPQTAAESAQHVLLAGYQRPQDPS